MLWGVFELKCLDFQKYDFSRISIDRNWFSTDRKCFNLLRKLSGWIDRSKLILDQSNKFSTDRMCFSIDRKSSRLFLKRVFFMWLFTFQIFFKSFCLPTNRSKLFLLDLSFSSDIFAKSFSPKAGMPILPLLLHLFSCFMHYFHAFLGIFGI